MNIIPFPGLRLFSASAFASGPALLTVQQLCGRLGISEATARRYSASEPGFPTKLKLGPRRVAFRAEDVERYVRERFDAARAVKSA